MFTDYIMCYRIRFPGFRIRVVCFNPELQNQEGCLLEPFENSNLRAQKKKREIAQNQAQIHVSKGNTWYIIILVPVLVVALACLHIIYYFVL